MRTDPAGVPHLQEPQPEQGTHIAGEELGQAPSTGKRERKSSHKEAPKKIYFCAKPDCSHAFEGGIGRRPCYVQNGSFSKGQHKKACGGGYRWLEVCVGFAQQPRISHVGHHLLPICQSHVTAPVRVLGTQ